MRLAIATRIFGPEPSAASFRLAALAESLTESGHDVTVLTTEPPAALGQAETESILEIRRFPVLRDRSGYVRGYLQYMSFDIPLFFRVLLARRFDALVVEPPPTTGVAVRLATMLRRIPYFYYGADVWSDAAASTGAPSVVVKVVRLMERFVLSGSRGVLSVNEGVTSRILQICPSANVETVGNGIDTVTFSMEGPKLGPRRFLLYSGTASEWQGAAIFVRAMAALREEIGDLRLVFLGQGSAWLELQRLATELDAPVDFVDAVAPDVAAAWSRGAIAGLASIHPQAGYDFAFPTKIFAAWSTGTPVVFVGNGPARAILGAESMLGIGVDYRDEDVIDAIRGILRRPDQSSVISEWARSNVSLRGVADKSTRFISDQCSWQ